MRFSYIYILFFLISGFAACGNPPEILSERRLRERQHVFLFDRKGQKTSETYQDTIESPKPIDYLRYGYTGNKGSERDARNKSRENVERVVPEEGEVLKKLYDFYWEVDSRVWTSIAPSNDGKKEESFHIDFLSIGIELPVYDYRDIGGFFQANKLEAGDLLKLKHLKGLSFATIPKHGPGKFLGVNAKTKRRIYERYGDLDFEVVGEIKSLKYFRPPMDVTDNDLIIMKNLQGIEELNLRGCYELRGRFISEFNDKAALRVLKISKITLNIMNATYLKQLDEIYGFQYIELSTDVLPIRTRRIYKDEIAQWLRDLF